MTWKIRGIDLAGSRPYIALIDPRADLHLEIGLVDREVDVFIGGHRPEESRLHVTVDVEGIRVERAEGHTRRDCRVVDNVLETLGQRQAQRRAAMDPCWASAPPVEQT